MGVVDRCGSRRLGGRAVRGPDRASRAGAQPPMRRPSSSGCGRRRRPAASRAGLFERAAAGFVPDPDVVELALLQPEHSKPVGAYVSDVVSQQRIDTGRQLAAAHAALLEAIEAAYGVDRHILLAIWGIESRYGAQMGSRSVIRSLATLAMMDARRSELWRRELIAALRLVQEGAVAPDRFVGSWAGAGGHMQFMPSTYATRAVDFDKDGRRDVWGSVADALASAANYLKASGWVAGVRWGQEVALPADFDFAWSAPGRVQTPAGMAGRRRQDDLGPRRAAPGTAAAARSACGCGRAGLPGHGEFSRAAQVQPVDGLCAERRSPGRPHRRRDGAGGILARGRQASQPGPAPGAAGPACDPRARYRRDRRRHRRPYARCHSCHPARPQPCRGRPSQCPTAGAPAGQRGALRTRWRPAAGGHVVDSLRWQGNCSIFPGLRLREWASRGAARGR